MSNFVAMNATAISNNGILWGISGNNSVWSSGLFRNGSYFWNGVSNQLIEPWSVKFDTTDRKRRNPQISGSNVVWSPSDSRLVRFQSQQGGFSFQGDLGSAFSISVNNVAWDNNSIEFSEGAISSSSEIFFWDGGSVTRITNNDLRDGYPAVSGNNVAWVGDVRINNTTVQGQIFFWNGTTTTRISDTTFLYNNERPLIDGTNIVYRSGSKIFLYRNGQQQQIGIGNNVQLSGNRVVWQAPDGNDQEIYLWNGSQVIQLSNNAVPDTNPQISGMNVVWTSGSGDNREIFLFDGSMTRQLTRDSVEDRNPHISGENISWERFNPNFGTYSILMKKKDFFPIYSSISHILNSNFYNLILTGTENINGTGNSLNNTIIGNSGQNVLTGFSGNDYLDGGSGSDHLTGGLGNDIYIVDNPGDLVTELVSEGIDTAKSSISYSLTSNVENLLLTGIGNVSGTGNTLNNTITGNSGSNSLNGGLGADRLVGGAGNDTYVRDNAGDVIVENAGQGIDTVFSILTYSLAANVENLTLTGSSAINGAGNTLNNTITGNGGNNSLNGGAGADRLVGGAGNDTYVRDNAGDVIVENAGQGIDTVFSILTYSLAANVENLTLTGSSAINGAGNTLNNTITGNAGNNILIGGAGADLLTGAGGSDTLIGGAGADRLTGGAGNDFFRLNARTEGIDTIKDFSKVSGNTDKIQILASGFGGGLTTGLLAATRFVFGTSATNTNHRFIYNQGAGALFFDADGLGGTAQTQIAVLSNKPGLGASDIVVV